MLAVLTDETPCFLFWAALLHVLRSMACSWEITLYFTTLPSQLAFCCVHLTLNEQPADVVHNVGLIVVCNNVFLCFGMICSKVFVYKQEDATEEHLSAVCDKYRLCEIKFKLWDISENTNLPWWMGIIRHQLQTKSKLFDKCRVISESIEPFHCIMKRWYLQDITEEDGLNAVLYSTRSHTKIIIIIITIKINITKNSKLYVCQKGLMSTTLRLNCSCVTPCTRNEFRACIFPASDLSNTRNIEVINE